MFFGHCHRTRFRESFCLASVFEMTVYLLTYIFQVSQYLACTDLTDIRKHCCCVVVCRRYAVKLQVVIVMIGLLKAIMALTACTYMPTVYDTSSTLSVLFNQRYGGGGRYSDISKWVMQWDRVRVRVRDRVRVKVTVRVRVSVSCTFS